MSVCLWCCFLHGTYLGHRDGMHVDSLFQLGLVFYIYTVKLNKICYFSEWIIAYHSEKISSKCHFGKMTFRKSLFKIWKNGSQKNVVDTCYVSAPHFHEDKFPTKAADFFFLFFLFSINTPVGMRNLSSRVFSHYQCNSEDPGALINDDWSKKQVFWPTIYDTLQHFDNGVPDQRWLTHDRITLTKTPRLLICE